MQHLHRAPKFPCVRKPTYTFAKGRTMKLLLKTKPLGHINHWDTLHTVLSTIMSRLRNQGLAKLTRKQDYKTLQPLFS